MSKNILALSCAGVLFLFSGCQLADVCDHNTTTTSSSTAEEIFVDLELRSLIDAHNLTGDPSAGIDIPSINSPKAQLGMQLFYSKALGVEKDSACVSCHHPALAGGDALSLSIGVEALDPDLLGVGRIHDPSAPHYNNGYALVPRNAPTTFNVALWKRALAWDGRIENVLDSNRTGIRTPDTPFGIIDENAGANLAAAQVRFPVFSDVEMKGFDYNTSATRDDVRQHLQERLNDPSANDYIDNEWQKFFTPVYGENSVTFDNIADAIGEYENSQLFIDNSWKKYVEGNVTALSASAKRGAKLFFNSYQDGGFSCVTCHSGDFFTDESYHVMAVPQVGLGKDANEEDFGRYRETGDMKYAFRTPNLMNVALTGPWGHDGAYTTLEAMVRHMINPDKSVIEYDFSQLDANVKTTNTVANTAKALAQLQANREFGISPHLPQEATDEQVNDLVEFLKSLTDPCITDKECIGQWIPTNGHGPDCLQLNAVDANGNLL